MVSLMENVDEDLGTLALISSRGTSLGIAEKTELAASQLSAMPRQCGVQQSTANPRTYLASQEGSVAHTELTAVLVGVVMVPGPAHSKLLWVCR